MISFSKWLNDRIKMASLAQNAIWNMIRVGSNVVFPLITFPYTARVLGPAVRGEYDYVYAIVAYFILFANLGFPVYGIREISKRRDSRKELSDTVSAIFTANILSVIVALFCYISLILFVPNEERMLFIVVGVSIMMSCIQFDWFYQGVEDFKYITIRSLIIKSLSIIALFTFVTSKEDLIAFALISVVGEFGNNLFNLLRIVKYADLRFSTHGCLMHIKGASALFWGAVAVSLYTQLNTVMLGILDTKESVGYFTAGNKMVQLVLSVITAMLATIIPRISYQLGNGQQEEGHQLQYKVLKLTLYIGYPLVIMLIFLSGEIVRILAGDQFLPSIPVLIVLSLLVLLIPISNFLGLQVLFPVNKEKYGTYAVVSGAIANILLNYVLVVHFSYVGIAFAVLIAEFVVTVVHYYYAQRYLKIPLTLFFPYNCLLAVLSVLLFLIVANNIYNEYNILSLVIKGGVAALLYLLVLFIRRDDLCMEIFSKFKK